MALTFLSPLHRATRQIGLWFESRLTDFGGVEGHLLSYLVPYGPCTVTELVRVFGVKHSTMTSILDRLEDRGFVERKDNPEDKRSWLVGLTRKGRGAASRVNVLVDEIENAIGSRVTKRDLEGFNRVIEAIGEATGVTVRES